MEEWQLTHLQENRVPLSKNITISESFLAHFLAADKLTEDEKNRIIGKATPADRVFAFLDSIKQKPCYNQLVTALEAERLIGAANILKKHTNYTTSASSRSSDDSTDLKNQRLKHLIVGDPGCEINKILKVLRKQSSFYLVLDKWQALSGDLGISLAFVKRLEKKQNLHGMSEIDIMTDVLHEWRSRKSKLATLYELVSQLDENEMEQLADSVRDEFGTTAK